MKTKVRNFIEISELSHKERHTYVQKIAEKAAPLYAIDHPSLTPLLENIGQATVVFLGEATHGTAEFYSLRAKITQELICNYGFNIVALEADWPDVEIVNRHIRSISHGATVKKAFTRFPIWMWKNLEFHQFIEWLRHYNFSKKNTTTQVNIYGLDLYGLSQSIDTIIAYLDRKDEKLAQLARKRYGCLLSWSGDLTHYGLLTTHPDFKDCEEEVIQMLLDLSRAAIESKEERCSLLQNAYAIVSAEKYYRTLYSTLHSSWNIRDQHMFEVLKFLLSANKNGQPKTVIWAHNSHIGDASATEMFTSDEFNLGQLSKEHFGKDAYLIGFGTHKGTVAAASYWGGPLQIKPISPSHPESFERLCHETNKECFFLPLNALHDLPPRLERAIGVVYSSENERQSHYFSAHVPSQFDSYIWIDHTHPITPLAQKHIRCMPETYPFGL